MRPRFLFLVVVWVLGSAGARAQAVPEARSLLNAWAASQKERAHAILNVSFREQEERITDGPFGNRVMKVESRVSGTPGTDHWERRILAMKRNGHVVPPDQWNRHEAQWQRSMRSEYRRLTQVVMMPVRLLGQMEPVGEATEETVDEVSCWRYEAVPRNPRSPIKHVTVWLARDTGHLYRVVVNVRSTRRADANATFMARVDYARHEGFDLPRRRYFEGTMQSERRGRVFTLLAKLTATFDDYRFEFE